MVDNRLNGEPIEYARNKTITNEDYWDEYNNFQQEKHNIIKNYLNGWFPKLGTWNGRVLYIDTHAGRGRHKNGNLGSPLIALDTLLHHSYFPKLKNCEFIFCFIERNESNLSCLRHELEKNYNNLPQNVHCETIEGDCFNIIEEWINYCKNNKSSFPPSFIFVDPYGFKIPGRVVKELMSFERVELFMNIMWRELDMAICQKSKMKDTLNYIFDGNSWEQRINAIDSDDRTDQAAQLFRELTHSKWYTYVKMIGDNRKTRYFLLHLTNHDKGRDLMKECMWDSCPEGGFYVKKFENPDQLYLIEREPDFKPLEDWIIYRIKQTHVRWKSLYQDLRPEIWLEKQLNECIRNLRNKKIIEGKDYKGRFSSTTNPLLYLR